MTHQTQLVLLAMLDAPTEETYGLAVSEAVGLTPGAVYPILQRLEDAGWVARRRELPSERKGTPGRPRHYYRLTGHGERMARQVLSPRRSEALRSLSPGWMT